MSKTKTFLFVLMMLAIAPIVVLMMSNTASAIGWPTSESLDFAAAACPSESAQYPELVRLREEISTASSLNEARSLALAPTSEAIDGLRNARTIMPFSEDLRLAETHLSDARSRIEAADTPDQVADEFSGMMLAGLDDDRVAGVSVGKVVCD